MGATDALKLPFPEITDMADGPDAVSDLANAVEDYVYDRKMPLGISRYLSHHWGSGGAYPTGTALRLGDTFLHTGLKSIMRFNGSVWRQVEPAEVADVAARRALPTSLMHSMFKAYEADTGRLVEWRGNRWRLTAPENYSPATGGPSGGTGSNENFASTTPLWVPQSGEKITMPSDGIYREITLSHRVHVRGDGWIRFRSQSSNGTAFWPSPGGNRTDTGGGETVEMVLGWDALSGSVSNSYFAEYWATAPGSVNFYSAETVIFAH